jgi:hypothetical protein
VIYSVWNQAALAYDYYEAPGGQNKVNAPQPKHLHPSKLGLTVKQAGWPLPAGAVHKGRGALPEGRIASFGSGSALGDIELGKAGLIVLGGLVIMFMVMR